MQPYRKMSEYFKSLDPATTDRYVARLQLLGIAKADDPFAPWNGIYEVRRQHEALAMCGVPSQFLLFYGSSRGASRGASRGVYESGCSGKA